MTSYHRLKQRKGQLVSMLHPLRSLRISRQTTMPARREEAEGERVKVEMVTVRKAVDAAAVILRTPASTVEVLITPVLGAPSENARRVNTAVLTIWMSYVQRDLAARCETLYLTLPRDCWTNRHQVERILISEVILHRLILLNGTPHLGMWNQMNTTAGVSGLHKPQTPS